MQLFANTLSGKTVTLAASAATTVADLKAQIHAKDAMPVDAMRLIYAGKQLDDEMLVSAEMDAEATVHVVASLDGGAKKRKKKNYTTPKKIKHKRKPVKLAILKYYQIDASGKINRVRRECPSEGCGAAIFMANHHDRQYCGKCGLTLVIGKN